MKIGKAKFKDEPRFGCNKCGKEASIEFLSSSKLKVSHCGISEYRYKKGSIQSGNKDLQGRLHGHQHTFSSGELHYRHGSLDYLDDGNGNVFDGYDEDDHEDLF